MKVEMTNIRRNDQLLKTEAMILQKLKFSDRVPGFYGFGNALYLHLLILMF